MKNRKKNILELALKPGHLHFAILILILSIFSLNAEIDWDQRLSSNIREDLKNPPMDFAMQGITVLGSKEFALGANLALYTFGNSELDDKVEIATISLATGAIVTTSLKAIVNRKRPLQGNNEKTSRWDSSFPSGHTTSAFAMATAYGLQDRELLAPLLIGAAAVGFSRIYLGEHYFLDVIIGAIIGTASAIVVYQFKDEINDALP